MSLLAAAGIYLILDVNSPLQGQHLNRYEPWTTYSEKYMTHVYKVVNEFSGYNNTLAFFAGNEIVNDEKSASTAPTYIKGVIRDIKYFLKKNNIRSIPVGYSAADDLSYRIPLAEYLECYESDPLETVDFYGVNTYQWCGHQTFLTSGYNELVKDYSSYAKPIFFSEYGCNEVVPRVFEEISAIYSDQMTAVFSGGLVYEFVQEQNDYGLIDYDNDGNVKVLPDFNTFKSQISKIIGVSLSKNLILEDQKSIDSKKNDKNQFGRQSKVCGVQYKNLDVSKGIPKPVAESVVKKFKSEKRGKFVSLNEEDMKAKFKIFNSDGSILVENPAIRPVSKLELETNDIESCEYYTKNKSIRHSLMNEILRKTCICYQLKKS